MVYNGGSGHSSLLHFFSAKSQRTCRVFLQTTLLLGVSLTFLHCSSTTGDDEEEIRLERLEISPANPSLFTGETASDPVDFSVTAYWSNGKVLEDIAVTWKSSNSSLGTFSSEGVFTPAGSMGGNTLISAEYLGIETSTLLTVVLTQTLIEEDLPESLADSVTQATVQIDDAVAPFVLYPFDGTIVPRNIPRFDVHWTPGPGLLLTVLEFTSPTSVTRVLTTDDRWYPSKAEWSTIAATNSGGEVALRVLGGVLEGEGEARQLTSDLFTAESVTTVGISRMDTTGAIYYWSSTDRGIKRISNESELTQDFYIPAQEDSGCASCHTLSPSGQRMSVVYPADGGGYNLGLLALEPNRPPEVLVNRDDEVHSGRGTFSPDERYFLGVENGKPSLYDGRTGTFLQPVDMGFEKVAHMSFSPDGTEVVFAVPTSFLDDSRFYDARIASIPFDDGVFGNPVWLTPKVEGFNQYYPSYSPDGAWIAYNQSVSFGMNAPEGDTMMDSSSEIYLVPREGGSPIRLARLSVADEARLGELGSEPTPPPEQGITGYANSLPVWGPLPDADLLWLSFTSYRGFGHEVKLGIPQIWLSAIEPSKAEAGQDPSHPPFWLPLQDPTTHNHIPQWGPF